MEANEEAKDKGRWDRGIPVGMVIMLMTVLYGCTETMVMEGLFGMEKYNVNQCLLRAQPTLSGIILPKGTRGTFREVGGRAEFIVIRADDGLPQGYDITDFGWYMRTCGPGD